MQKIDGSYPKYVTDPRWLTFLFCHMIWNTYDLTYYSYPYYLESYVPKLLNPPPKPKYEISIYIITIKM